MVAKARTNGIKFNESEPIVRKFEPCIAQARRFAFGELVNRLRSTVCQLPVTPAARHRSTEKAWRLRMLRDWLRLRLEPQRQE